MAVVCLDFDGVLHQKPADSLEFGPPVGGALDAVQHLLAMGHHVVVSTCRAYPHGENTGAGAVHAWMRRHGFPRLRVTSSKPIADLYVDDRGFRFAGPGSWRDLFAGIQNGGLLERWGKE